MQCDLTGKIGEDFEMDQKYCCGGRLLGDFNGKYMLFTAFLSGLSDTVGF